MESTVGKPLGIHAGNPNDRSHMALGRKQENN